MVAAVYLVLMALSLPFNVTGREPPSWVEVASNIGIYAFVLIPLATAVAIRATASTTSISSSSARWFTPR